MIDVVPELESSRLHQTNWCSTDNDAEVYKSKTLREISIAAHLLKNVLNKSSMLVNNRINKRQTKETNTTLQSSRRSAAVRALLCVCPVVLGDGVVVGRVQLHISENKR